MKTFETDVHSTSQKLAKQGHTVALAKE